MALTRIPRHLINRPAPIRWTGTEQERLALLPADVSSVDVNFLYRQIDGKLYSLSEIGAESLTWVSFVSSDAEGLNLKLEKTDIVATPSSGVTATADENTNTVTIAGVDASTSAKGVVTLASDSDLSASDQDFVSAHANYVPTISQLRDVKANAFARSDLSNSDGTIVLDTTGAGNSIVISAVTATDAQAGVVEIATDQEVSTGTSTSTVMTTKQVMDEVAKALVKDFSALTAVTNNVADSDLLAIRSGNDNLKVTAAELKAYVIAEIQQAELFKGYFADEAALNDAWDGSTAAKTPAPGSFAILESTDSVWVWNSATEESEDSNFVAQWEDTRIRGTVDASTQVIAGTGLTGGGALASNVTLNVAYGTTSGTACEGNDARLSRTPVVWTGDSTAFASVTPEDWHEGYLYVVTGVAADTFNRRVYKCVDYDAANQEDKFELMSEDAKAESILTFSGTIASGENTITLPDSAGDLTAKYIEVYLTGIRQDSEAFVATYEDTDEDTVADSTVITLSENVSTDLAYVITVYPFSATNSVIASTSSSEESSE